MSTDKGMVEYITACVYIITPLTCEYSFERANSGKANEATVMLQCELAEKAID